MEKLFFKSMNFRGFVVIICLFLISNSLFSKPLPKLIPYRIANKWGYCDSAKKIIVPCRFTSVNALENGYATVFSGNKYGFIDSTGKIYHEAEFEFDDHRSFGAFEGNFLVVMKNKVCGMIDKKNKWIIQPQYDFLLFESANKIYARLGNKSGYVDTTGKILFPFIYDSVSEDERGCFIVSKKEKFGLVDKNNKLIIPIVYDQLTYANEGMYRIFMDSIPGKVYPRRSGYIDSTGKIIHPCNLHRTSQFQNGLAAICESSLFGYMDKKGNLLIDYTYNYGGEFSCGRACVTLNGKYGYIDSKGIVVIPIIYSTWNVMLDRGKPFKNNCVIVQKDKKYGIIDTTGKEILECIYGGIWEEENGRYFIVSNGRASTGAKLFFTDGRLVENNVAQDSFLYVEGPRKISVAPADSVFYYLTQKGDTLNQKFYHSRGTYNCPKGFHDGYGTIFENGKAGFIDVNGKTIVQCKYDEVREMENGISLVFSVSHDKNNNAIQKCLGYIDHYGTEYWEN